MRILGKLILAGTYSRDDHKMIPLYFGARYYLQATESLRPFCDLAFGYSYLKYNSYDLVFDQHIDEGNTLLSVDNSTRESKMENLFSLGAGIGLQQDLVQNEAMLLTLRLTTYLGGSYLGVFNSNNTDYKFLIGLSYSI